MQLVKTVSGLLTSAISSKYASLLKLRGSTKYPPTSRQAASASWAMLMDNFNWAHIPDNVIASENCNLINVVGYNQPERKDLFVLWEEWYSQVQVHCTTILAGKVIIFIIFYLRHHLLSMSRLPSRQSWGAGGVATVATVGTNLKWDYFSLFLFLLLCLSIFRPFLFSDNKHRFHLGQSSPLHWHTACINMLKQLHKICPFCLRNETWIGLESYSSLMQGISIQISSLLLPTVMTTQSLEFLGSVSGVQISEYIEVLTSTS